MGTPHEEDCLPLDRDNREGRRERLGQRTRWSPLCKRTCSLNLCLRETKSHAHLETYKNRRGLPKIIGKIRGEGEQQAYLAGRSHRERRVRYSRIISLIAIWGHGGILDNRPQEIRASERRRERQTYKRERFGLGRHELSLRTL